VARFGALMLDQLGSRRRVLSPATAARLLDERQDGTLRAGFDGKAEVGSSVGTRMGERTFGHLGFTGTSLWCDPEGGVVVALLTNRVSPTRENLRIRAARPTVHDALCSPSEPPSDASTRPGP
jgi:CubicO group peptidase (beta-lactamase class C family)